MSKVEARASSGKRVAVIVHIFSHYRRPVYFEMIENSPHHYEFIGTDHDFNTGIKVINDFPEGRFHKVKAWKFRSIVFMPGTIRAAIGSRYDTLIILGNAKWPTMWLTAIIARLRGKRVLMWAHGWLSDEKGVTRLIRDTFYKLAHGLLVYNRRSKEIGVSHGFDPKRIHVVYNSLDSVTQIAVRDSITDADIERARVGYFPGRQDLPILTAVTRITASKKLDLLIDAAALLEERGTPVNVLIVGDGPEKARLEQLAKKNGVSACFAGAVYDERTLGVIFKATDLTVMPGAIGLLVMHSLVFGTPVVSHNNFDNQGPEYEAIVDGVTGGFFEENSVDSLAETVNRWLNDNEAKERGREESRAVIERFYNPFTQAGAINRAVSGLDADDSFEFASLGRDA